MNLVFWVMHKKYLHVVALLSNRYVINVYSNGLYRYFETFDVISEVDMGERLKMLNMLASCATPEERGKKWVLLKKQYLGALYAVASSQLHYRPETAGETADNLRGMCVYTCTLNIQDKHSMSVMDE